ncbi:MAG: competence/damage-inducible protein A [Deltaproteobacteria bacterium]|nr:competence/damage-inducible protein A [Deltaproteobacteria bacterium]
MAQVLSASCVVVGNEILSGKTRDSNAHHLARFLRTRGVDLQRIQVIPDVVELIGSVVAEESARSSVVFTSGGVGPTHDDVTYKGVARAFDLPVRRHHALAARMEDFYGPRLTAVRLRMADLPHPCELVHTDGMWVPVVLVRNVYVLPGIPSLFQSMLESLAPRLQGTPIRLQSIYTQQGESELAEHLEATLAAHAGVEIGSYPRMNDPDHRVRVTLESRDADLVTRATDWLLARLDPAKLVRVERD